MIDCNVIVWDIPKLVNTFALLGLCYQEVYFLHVVGLPTGAIKLSNSMNCGSRAEG